MLNICGRRYGLSKTENMKYSRQKIWNIRDRKYEKSATENMEHQWQKIWNTTQKLWHVRDRKYETPDRRYGTSETENIEHPRQKIWNTTQKIWNIQDRKYGTSETENMDLIQAESFSWRTALPVSVRTGAANWDGDSLLTFHHHYHRDNYNMTKTNDKIQNDKYKVMTNRKKSSKLRRWQSVDLPSSLSSHQIQIQN